MLHFVCSTFAVHGDLWKNMWKSMWKTFIDVNFTTIKGLTWIPWPVLQWKHHIKRKGGCMEEHLSWQARLAKRNINILNTNRQGDKDLDVYYEFMYHPKAGQTKWCKTMTHVSGQEVELSEGVWETLPVTGDDIANALSEEALRLRKELEG